MIKAVVFDVGGVLKFETDERIRADVEKTLGIAPEVFVGPWGALTAQLGSGKITEAEFWQQLHQQTGAQQPVPTDSLFMREYTKGFRINQETMAIAQRLRKAGYTTAILSNTITVHADFNREQGMFEGFDPVLLSHEIGLLKPWPEIFKHTLQQLKVAPAEAVLVDDREKNIVGTQQIGMHAILFKNAAQLEADLKELGLSF
jgi:putative hydrolase of the HAD superfamily